uniref:DUF1995 domain-containing protein n=1 Tax=Leptocylindrus danicus TaxID=163516 RepID=A0A7S2PCV2_9STRA
MIRLCASILSIIAASSAFTPSIQIKTHRHQTLLKSSQLAGIGQPTELPDSLEDAAQQAAKCCDDLVKFGDRNRCRVDFDTSVGDETYTTLKSSLTFGVEFIKSLSYALIPGAQQLKQDQMMRDIQAKAELTQLEGEIGPIESEEELRNNPNFERINQLQQIVANSGVMEEETKWNGPIFRVYFPDEGSAALARRDWKINTVEALVPPCVSLSSVGGVQAHDTTRDVVNLFFCPKASEAEFVEDILYKTEAGGNIVLSVFLNPNLVDMGVTGFGMAGRMLRERLLDDLAVSYYLRTLQWGALTRAWPSDFSVWQEDENSDGGYRLIKSLDNLPSNPEVEDIYDIENGLMNAPKDGPGFLNALGDFVNGMTRL